MMNEPDFDSRLTGESSAPDDISSKTYRGPRFPLAVLSHSRIRQAVMTEPYIVVSIGDSGDMDAEIAASPLCRAILCLRFDDIDPQRKSLRGGIAMMTEDARSLVDFVRSQMERTNVRMIVCQCGLGISRSAAVAAALSRHLQSEDAFFFMRFSPDRHVDEILLSALEDER